MFCSFLQGGGVFVSSGTVTMTSCSITGNTAYGSVRAHVETSHRPDGNIADVLASTRACTTANASVNYSRYVPQRPCNFPSPPWETHVLLVFTGRRCLCLFRHRHNDVLLDHRQHSFWIGACSCSKVPIAPMGFSHVLRLCLQGGGVWVQSGTVSFSLCTITGNSAGTVRAHAQKFPSPRWEFLLTCPNRLSSFNSDPYLVLSGICTCQPRLQTSHRLDGGKIADVLANLAP